MSRLLPIERECLSEGMGRKLEHGLSLSEGSGDGVGQQRAVKRELARQGPDIEEILHATVYLTELNHGFEFFRDGCFSAVSIEPRRREVNYGRVFAERRSRSEHVPEPEIELHWNLRILKPGEKSDP